MSYLLLLLLQQPISKLDARALSLTPWEKDPTQAFSRLKGGSASQFHVYYRGPNACLALFINSVLNV